MFECICAWACLVIGAFLENPLMMIASGAFAIATQISRIVDRMDEEQ